MARAACREALTGAGFQVREVPFEYSQWPGRYAAPTVGAILAATAAWVAVETGQGGVTLVPLLTIAITIVAIAALGGALIGRYTTLTFPAMRRRGVNVEAVRAGEPPRIWLVAHVDSKSQPIPMLVRIMGVMLCAAGWIALLILWSATALVHVPHTAFSFCTVAAALGALPIALSTVANASPGALDNASGVATVLAAAAQLDTRLPVGVVLTGAEELGLAGAHAWARGRLPGVAINCDGIDDTGSIVCMGSPRDRARLRDAVVTAGASSGMVPVLRGILPGVLVDAVALTGSGWTALTVSRGGWRSLIRIHTRHDDLGRMTGAGIDDAARFVARLAGAIVAREGGTAKAPALNFRG